MVRLWKHPCNLFLFPDIPLGTGNYLFPFADNTFWTFRRRFQWRTVTFVIEEQAVDLVRISRQRDLAASGTGRAIRLAARLSQEEIAQVLGVTRATVSRWENGLRTPRGDDAIAYGELLEVLMCR